MISLRRLIKNALPPLRPFTAKLESQLHRINTLHLDQVLVQNHNYTFADIEAIKRASLRFAGRLRVSENGRFVGYRFAPSTTKPLLYCTVAALLLKHLYGVSDPAIREELETVVLYQGDDGLFRDPAIACPAAEQEDWWGWRHLTLHALMTLALYGVVARRDLQLPHELSDKDRLRDYLNARDWGPRAAWTSNEVQNLGVMFQYARDYQNWQKANDLLDVLYDVIVDHQDPDTGLHGDRFDTPDHLSQGVQATYHFSLLFAYERRSIPHADRIVESVLRTQNLRGGYGVTWNSSACEDIDSIDLLVRLGSWTHRESRILKASLHRALSSLLTNLHANGGWVFRRDEPLMLPHSQMCSGPNECNLFYTWFRTLALAYCLLGLGDESPIPLRYNWQLILAPGHQLSILPPPALDLTHSSDTSLRAGSVPMS